MVADDEPFAIEPTENQRKINTNISLLFIFRTTH